MRCFTPRIVLLACVVAAAAAGQSLKLTPYHPTGIYQVGETVGWRVAAGTEQTAAGGTYTYTLKRNNFTLLNSGTLDLSRGEAKVEINGTEPEMLYLEIKGQNADKPIVAGAAVAPTELKPSAPRPPDFDAFWTEKIKLLQSIPAEPVLTPQESGRAGVDYATIRLNNINGSHVYGQIAKPAHEGKFPAMLIMQWAGGPYPLQKAWVVDRAAEGWLAMNIEPHDVPGDMPQAFYDALPAMLKQYNTIYNDDRERNYFLRMYLGDYRALDYLAGRPDWDGKILLAIGTSMGGQQTLAVSGLHPKVTHLIACVPAGADSNAVLHGRHEGYPYWDVKNPKVAATALYFDTVNFASHIHATAFVAMGFVDNTCPAVGVWTAFNQIPGRKEAVPMIDSPHNNLATPAQLRAFNERSAAWLAKLVHDEEPEVRDGTK